MTAGVAAGAAACPAPRSWRTCGARSGPSRTGRCCCSRPTSRSWSGCWRGCRCSRACRCWQRRRSGRPGRRCRSSNSCRCAWSSGCCASSRATARGGRSWQWLRWWPRWWVAGRRGARKTKRRAWSAVPAGGCSCRWTTSCSGSQALVRSTAGTAGRCQSHRRATG